MRVGAFEHAQDTVKRFADIAVFPEIHGVARVAIGARNGMSVGEQDIDHGLAVVGPGADVEGDEVRRAKKLGVKSQGAQGLTEAVDSGVFESCGLGWGIG